MSFRLLARIPQRPPCIFCNKYAIQRNHTFSTVFTVPRRLIDLKALENLKTTLLYVLRPAVGREHGFGHRRDGYTSVKRLLKHPEFQSLDIAQLQAIVSGDKKHRFDFQFDPSKGSDLYWIRAKKYDEVNWVLKPVFPRDQPGVPVYETTLEQWHSHIARNGVPRGDLEWIEISRHIPTQEYLLDLEDNHQVFIFLNLAKCMEAGLRFFSPTPHPQKWTSKTPLITKGNNAGYIPPSLFSRVEFVTAKKKVLWGNSKAIDYKGWVGYDPVDFDADGKRKTFSPPGKGITGFVLSDSEPTPGLRLQDVPGLKEEAMSILYTKPSDSTVECDPPEMPSPQK